MPELRALGPRASALGSALTEASRRLAGAGVPDPQREAIQVWSALTGRPAGDAWLRSDEDVPESMRARLDRAVAQRASGVPFAYATGFAAFRTLSLQVDRRTLIPRPETEGLVERVLAWHTAEAPGPRAEALDVGTGSGCIALSLAAEGAFARIVATDVSADALAVARANHDRLRPAVPVTFRQGAFFAPLAAGERFDVIVSNPPYIAEREYAALDPSVRAHEPADALVSGPDGLAHVRRILAEAHAWLRPGGLLALEVDSRRADAALALARDHQWSASRVDVDLFGRPRFLLATKP